MQARAKRGLQTLRRARDFLAEKKLVGLLGPISKQVELLTGVIDRLAALGVEQDVATLSVRAGTKSCRGKAHVLKDEYMRAVARQVKVALSSDEAAVRSLKMPKVGDYEGLITAALAMATTAEPYREKLIAEGFADDFLDRLRGAVGELQKDLDARAEWAGRRGAATAGIGREYVRARDIVRALDSMVKGRLEGGEAAQWRMLSRFMTERTPEDAQATPAAPIVTTPPGAPVPSISPPVERSTPQSGQAEGGVVSAKSA
jgi:hypothetical protein